MHISPINDMDKAAQELASSQSLELMRAHRAVSKALILAACANNRRASAETRIAIAESQALLSKLENLGY